jgi:hypothetical protein
MILTAGKHTERKQTQRQKKVFTIIIQRFCDPNKKPDSK